MKNKPSILMLTDHDNPKELLERALIALNREHQRRLQNQGASYGHDKYRKRAEKKIADYENAILILGKKEVNFISSKPDVSGSLPPLEDERIFKSVTSKWRKEYAAGIPMSEEGESAMKYIAERIFKDYEVRRRQ